ncbi:class I SAM-dependent methyltransferase [Streptomyces venezuelae]|uniref:SAM-dependent methyltransferase n=1 Tax=Streptomyces venezuelae TaxID=54571 RepID=A0A5P2BKT9_STRVZ|nr:class I SAM-dependent methyltransferase [Streptomyces venezuelae]QES31105.1 SAM-dependent methyltransferase [Streptomyces venezuelae]
MAADWRWDETLFRGAAAHYARGRLPYAPGLAMALAEALEPDGTGRLIDVGCGPGTLALTLAPLFREVVGVDPDVGMIAEAERDATGREVAGRTHWVCARAEDLPAGLGTFSAATFGQSFHWMDQVLVATTVKRMLRPGGALVHISDLKPEAGGEAGRPDEDLPHPAPPRAAVDDLVRTYLGPVRRAGRGVLPHGTAGGEREVLKRAGFAGPQRLVVPGGQVLERSVDDVVAEVFSMSSSAPHLFGDRRDRFETDLRTLLRAASAADRFSERGPSTEVFIWRTLRNDAS